MTGTSVEQLLANADMALDRAKGMGAAVLASLSPIWTWSSGAGGGWPKNLGSLSRMTSSKLVYQAQVKIPSAEVIGFEALLRWHHPEQGMLSPAVFIPIAEETGLIIPIGEWVLRTLAGELRVGRVPTRWPSIFPPNNFRAETLPTWCTAFCCETGLSPGRLELEITETALFDDLQQALDDASTPSCRGRLSLPWMILAPATLLFPHFRLFHSTRSRSIVNSSSS